MKWLFQACKYNRCFSCVLTCNPDEYVASKYVKYNSSFVKLFIFIYTFSECDVSYKATCQSFTTWKCAILSLYACVGDVGLKSLVHLFPHGAFHEVSDVLEEQNPCFLQLGTPLVFLFHRRPYGGYELGTHVLQGETKAELISSNHVEALIILTTTLPNCLPACLYVHVCFYLPAILFISQHNHLENHSDISTQWFDFQRLNSLLTCWLVID